MGECVAGTNPCAEGELCDEETEVCAECFADADCDDGSFCNGAELCNNGQCDAGTSPCEADEACNETTEQCEVIMCMDGGDCSFGSVCYAENICTTDEPAKLYDTLFIAGGGWWQFPKYASYASRFVFYDEWRIAMVFDEDYATCSAPPTGILKYRPIGSTKAWKSVDGTPYPESESVLLLFDLPYSSMPDGAYELRVGLTDCARNMSDSRAYYFTLDLRE